jgi:16S rRNA (guanine527-N7)-methyltransferase
MMNIHENRQLKAYLDILNHCKDKINLVSKKTTVDDLENHIMDCCEILPHIPQQSKVLDIGTGAGFPGIILAILRQDCTVYLSEINKKKCVFLRNVIFKLNLANAFVIEGSVETIQDSFSVVTSRAMSELKNLLSCIIVTPETRAVFLKGQHLEQELINAKEKFSFDYEIFKGKTFDHRQIITLSDIRPLS